jgi:glycosyltransferase involved in cell wall biosynthesis
MIKISIIIPFFNVEKHIKKCLNSVISQNISTDDYEIILINDGSTDNTLNEINTIIKGIKNIIVYTQINTGLGGARNKGLELANGEYVWFIDSDDYIEKNSLLEMLTLIFENKLDVLAINYNIVDDKGIIISNKQFLNSRLQCKYIDGPTFYFDNYTYSYSCMFIFRRKLFIDNNLRFKERINMQDSEILPKLMYYTYRLSFFNKHVYNYVQHSNSFTNSNNFTVRYNYFKSIIEVRNSLLDFLKIIDNNKLNKSINLKINDLNNVVLNHLVFFHYDIQSIQKVIALLTEHGLFPIKAKVKGKMKLIKKAINLNPVIALKIFQLIRKY